MSYRGKINFVIYLAATKARGKTNTLVAHPLVFFVAFYAWRFKVMARGRMLLKSISMSEKMKELSSDTARLLYTWMLTHLDVNGCYLANPVVIKNTIFPWQDRISTNQIENYLQEMENQHLIVRYGSKKYLCYPDFKDKQPCLRPDRESRPTISPPTPEQLQSYSRVTTAQVNISKGKLKEVNTHVQMFNEFWKVYPKRENKKKAQEIYIKLAPDKELHQKILRVVTAMAKTEGWTKDKRKFVPLPTTWLNGERWNDEIPNRPKESELNKEYFPNGGV